MDFAISVTDEKSVSNPSHKEVLLCFLSKANLDFIFK